MFASLAKFCGVTLFALAALGQVRFAIRVVAVTDQLTSDDITYLGAIRMPTSGVDTYITQGGLAGRKVGGDTHLFLFGTTSLVDYPVVYEIDVTGLTPNTTIASAPRATLYANWGKVFNETNKRSWDIDGNEESIESGPGSLFAGLYYNEDTDLLYAGYHLNYTTNILYSMAAASLDNPVGPVVTRYGPWKFDGEDQDAQTKTGTRAHWFIAHPTTGKMLATGAVKSGIQTTPWGPALYGDNDWPTTTTPSGHGSATIDQVSEYLDYRSPTEVVGPYDKLGNVMPGKEVKQFRYRDGFTFVHEVYDVVSTSTNPALTGIASWVETSTILPAVWFEGTHKRGVIYVGAVQGGLDDDVNDCTTTAHPWYRNANSGYVQLTSVSGTFVHDEVIIGSTSLTDANVNSSYDAPYLLWTSNPDDDFEVGETIVGQTSKASGTITALTRFTLCNHGCASPTGVTGNTSTLTTPVMIIMDPDDLNAVKAGTQVDWEVEATEMFSLEAAPYSIVVSAQDQQGSAKGVAPGYFDPTTNRLYLRAAMADCTRTGNCNAAESLIHVFDIDDTAPPVPSALMPAAAGFGLLAFGSLIRRKVT